MPIETTGSVVAEVPPGSQVEFRITDAEVDPTGKYGPHLPLDLRSKERAQTGGKEPGRRRQEDLLRAR